MHRKCSSTGPTLVILVAAVVALALVGASLMSLPRSVDAAPPAQDASRKCVGLGSTTVFPDATTRCGPFDVEVVGQPLCEACRAGLKVVFVQREQATDARWMNREAAAALDALDKAYGGELQAGVVHYSPAGSRIVQRLTTDLDRVKSALGRPTNVTNPPDANFVARQAAKDAVGLLRNPKDCVDCPCRLVVFFGQDPPTPG